jgi:hypothetical protein
MAKLLTTLKFGEWLPDLPPFDNPGSPNVNNCLWVDGAYAPALAFAGLGAANMARVQGAIACLDTDGDTHVYIGDAGALKEWTGTGFTTLASGFSLTDDGYWEFVPFSTASFPGIVVATDLNDAMQYMDVGSGSFTPLPGSPPKAQHIAAIGQFLMVGHTEDPVNGSAPSRVQWCGIGDPTYWGFQTLADQQNQAGQQFMDASFGPVTHISDGFQSGLIFQEQAITQAYYVGGDVIFNFNTYERKRGTRYPNACAQIGNLVYFISDDGFCVTDGQSVTPIGHGKVDSTFLAQVSQQFAERVRAAVDPIRKLIHWSYCSNGSSTGTPDSVLAYNYAEGTFTRITDPDGAALSLIFSGRSLGYTMEGLDGVNPDLDLITPSLDDPYWQGGQEIVQAFDSSNGIGALTGTALDASLDTTESTPNPGGMTYIDGVRVIATAGSGAPEPAVTVLTRNLEDADYTSNGFSARNGRTGRNDGRATGRYVRARVTLPGGANGFGQATGVDIYGSPAGEC